MREKILLIDDDFDFLEATRVLLEAQGYTVISAGDGKDGFAKVKQESPDLVLLDLMMRYKTEGLDTARLIEENAASREVPVILITGAHREMDLPKLMHAQKPPPSVKAVLEKPIQPQRLLEIIARQLAARQEHQQAAARDIEAIASRWKNKPDALVMVLHAIQNHYRYVPRGVAFELSRILDVPLARIYEVLTFYNYFKLEPPGRHVISVCMGTACYLKGAPQLLAELKRILSVEEEHSTSDGLFHLQIVRCLGCCGLAPVITIGERVYGKVVKSDIVEIISPYMKEGAQAYAKVE